MVFLVVLRSVRLMIPARLLYGARCYGWFVVVALASRGRLGLGGNL